MLILKTAITLQNYLESKSQPVGFVPTMGALHEGHLSLIEASKKENEITVCSIFVNPTQFNDKLDYDKYPITLEADIEKLISSGCDVLFLPAVDEMYPEGLNSVKEYNIGFLDTVLDGAFRPGHFNGVCVIVHKLLDAVKPNHIYLGEKDFQQCLVISQMIEQEKLKVKVHICPTLREINGLAKSSRNQRLSQEGKETASAIFECLSEMKKNWQHEKFETIQKNCMDKLTSLGFKTEYLMLANAETLAPLLEFDATLKMLVLIASHFEGVRLIDNMRLN